MIATTPLIEPDYLAAIQAAYEGEIRAEARFAALAEVTGAEHGDKLLALAELERVTAERMMPLMLRYGLSPAADCGARGAASVAEYAGQSWMEILDGWLPRLRDYVALYDALAARAKDEDREVLEFLAAHERALETFVVCELAGDSDSALRAVRSLIAPDVPVAMQIVL